MLAVVLSGGFACAAATNSTPEVPVVETLESASADWAVRAELIDKPVSGFVLLHRQGVKWPTAQEALKQASATSPLGPIIVHRVVKDLGKVVEVEPLADRAGEHCYVDNYETARRYRVSAFVHKSNLEVVLAADETVEGHLKTRYELKKGVRVVEDEEEGAVAMAHDKLPLAISSSAKFALSYDEVTPFERPYRDYHFDRGRGEEPTFVGRSAKLRIGDLSFSGKDLLVSDDDEDTLAIADAVEGEGRWRTVTVTKRCVLLHARVKAKSLREGYERRGSVAGTIGYGGGVGFGSLGRARRAVPPPKEHYAPEGTRLFWKGSNATAGTLGFAFRSYPLRAPHCQAIDQGLVENTEVCFAPEAVVRDCRDVCKNKGACAVSPDGARCIASTAAHCKASHNCEFGGQCTLRSGQCVAASDDDCAGAFSCTSEPHACMAHQGRCLVTPNPDCANRPACKLEGRCAGNDIGSCVAASASVCAASPPCKEEGLCGLRYKRCAPTNDTHCKKSNACAERGLCKRGGDKCAVASSVACRRSAHCKKYGHCVLLKTPRGAFGGGAASYCGPGSDADCRASAACSNDQKCTRKQMFVRWRCE